jgi:EF-P beta-lysylation protein EpmB
MDLWKQILKTNLRGKDQLISFLNIDNKNASFIINQKAFPLNLPLRIAKKIKKNCLQDPLFLQFVPLDIEKINKKDFIKDPLSEKSFKKTPKLLMKYFGRALILTTEACSMNCRFCFRKNFSKLQCSPCFKEELSWIKKNTDIREVILSGGDPLFLSNKNLENLFIELDKIEHIKRIRLHTRFIIGIPERIDKSLLKILSASNKQIYFVIHCNHPKELDEDIFNVLKKIHSLGIPVLSQSTLLKKINDHTDVLENLFTLLSDNGIIPYYLHQLDKIDGASHFEVDENKIKKIYQELERKLSGYSLPKFVKEMPGNFSKTRIF